MKTTCALLVSFWATASAASECWQTPSPQELSGILSPKSGFNDNAQDCQQRCIDNNCVGVTFDLNKYCRIFDWVTTSFDTQEALTTWRCRAQLPLENAQRPGLDIATVPAVTADQCSYKCDATIGCYAYSWSSDNGGSCALKSDKPATSVGPFDGSVRSGEVYKCGRPYFDLDFSGADLSSAPSASWTGCCAICRRTTSCAGFTWTNSNGGTCWLKAKATMSQLVSKTGATSAFMFQGAATTGSSPCTGTNGNLEFFGKSEQYEVPNAAACREICLATNCAAFTHVVQRCIISDWVALSKDANILSPVTSWRCRHQLPQVNGNYDGLTIGTVAAIDADRCSYKCDDTRTCSAYSWSKANNGTCELKSNKPATVTAPFDGSVVSGEAYKCTPPQFDQDAVGTDLISVQRPVWSDCCGVCRRTNGCDGFSWSSYNGGTCFLKTKTRRDRTKAAPGVVSAYVFPTAASNSTCKRSTLRLVGATVFKGGVDSPDDCFLLCQYYNCTAISRDGLFCTVFAWVTDEQDMSSLESSRNEYWWCRPQLPQVNGDYTGSDLTNVPTTSAAACSYACEETYRCSAYTWSSGVCYMKTSKAKAVTGPSDGSIVSGEVIKFSSVYLDYDMAGQDVGSVQRETWPECKAACIANAACGGFAWSNYNGGTCWLKAHDGGKPDGKKTKGVISATIFRG